MLKVFVNPYCHLDGQGRLAGACPEAEPLRSGGPPLNRLVGAKRQEVPGSWNMTDTDPRLGPTGKSDIFYVFTTEPVSVNDKGALGHFYLQRFKCDELFEVKKDNEVPISQLARARAKAITEFIAINGYAPDEKTWNQQFALDTSVKSFAEQQAEKRAEAEAEEAKKQAAAQPPAPALARTKKGSDQ